IHHGRTRRGDTVPLHCIKKYFNSYTMVGRRNCVLATYASIAAIVLFFKLKPKKQAAVKDK
ncbi:unnamed protein product, partial [Ranitomeya imitator]